jgi:putative oxidoreductase
MDFSLAPYLVLFARLCVAGVFIASSVGKLMDKPGTEASMSRYPFLPAGSGKLIANVFPFIELAVGVMLLLGLFTRLAAFAALLLFVLFTGLIIYDLTHSQNSSCHCFGRLSDEKLTVWAVVRNVALMLLSLIVLLGFDGWLSLDSALNASNTSLPLVATGSNEGLPTAADAIPVVLLALATVLAIVLGGQALNMIRTTLRGMGYRS